MRITGTRIERSDATREKYQDWPHMFNAYALPGEPAAVNCSQRQEVRAFVQKSRIMNAG
jgi:hypothetical protein